MPEPPRPLRLLVVLPSWIGDAVMATPALRLVRDNLPGAFVGALARPGVDEVLEGIGTIDELHVDRARGVMGPKLVAARLRHRRYDTALLLTNSFSTALVTRLAFIRRRVGYDRDGRGILLTDRLPAPKRDDGRWAPVPAAWYYLELARFLLDAHPHHARLDGPWWESQPSPTPEWRMTLAVTDHDNAAADAVLERAGVAPDDPIALLNPGGNNPAKRWPPDRFARVADHVAERHGVRVLVNAAPAEADLAASVCRHATTSPVSLADHAMTLGALKALCQRARILVTNDTGPRHIAAALETPVVTLFGPTDPRWTTIHAPAGERIVLADPTLPPDQVADDHPDRCRVDRIEPPEVLDAIDRLLAGASTPDPGVAPPPGSGS